MTVKLDFEECLKDSPRFRAEIEVVQTDVSELETRLEKVLLPHHIDIPMRELHFVLLQPVFPAAQMGYGFRCIQLISR
ncbi:hypothetical protein GOODEAATRI_001279 [Goodea atripinnis]|uniref:BAR domain-containing protein n=1 Tax=Goodea atripinnis TaxID=208336 RepID=A0ABV0MXS4_9TELE